MAKLDHALPVWLVAFLLLVFVTLVPMVLTQAPLSVKLAKTLAVESAPELVLESVLSAILAIWTPAFARTVMILTVKLAVQQLFAQLVRMAGMKRQELA
jgi:hypothetical protein